MNSDVTHCVTLITKLFPKMALSNNKLYVLVMYAIEQNTIQTSIKEEVWYVCITFVNVLRTLLHLINNAKSHI